MGGNAFKKTDLNYELLSELLSYDADTGVIFWAKNKGKVRKGDIAGKIDNDGYKYIKIDYRYRPSSRIAWCLYYKEIPQAEIDHINGDRGDNRISNLRLCNRSENLCNRGLNKNNTSGFKGVKFVKKSGKWAARIKKNYKEYYLGEFFSPIDAHNAYVAASREIHKEYGRVM